MNHAEIEARVEEKIGAAQQKYTRLSDAHWRAERADMRLTMLRSELAHLVGWYEQMGAVPVEKLCELVAGLDDGHGCTDACDVVDSRCPCVRQGHAEGCPIHCYCFDVHPVPPTTHGGEG